MKKDKIVIISDTPGGNYLKKLQRMPPEFFLLGPHEIQHDDWCLILAGLPCNCDPDIVVRPLTHAPV